MTTEHPVAPGRCDLFINRKVVVEIKNAKELTADNAGQLMGYMQQRSVSHGLLLNFPKPGHGHIPQAMYHKDWTRQIVEQLLPTLNPEL